MLGNVAPPKTPMGINRRTDNTATRTPSACVPYTRRRNLGGEIGRELGDHRWNSSPRRVARFATPLDSGPNLPLPRSSGFKVLLRVSLGSRRKSHAVELDQIEGANDRGRAGPVPAECLRGLILHRLFGAAGRCSTIHQGVAYLGQ